MHASRARLSHTGGRLLWPLARALELTHNACDLQVVAEGWGAAPRALALGPPLTAAAAASLFAPLQMPAAGLVVALLLAASTACLAVRDLQAAAQPAIVNGECWTEHRARRSNAPSCAPARRSKLPQI